MADSFVADSFTPDAPDGTAAVRQQIAAGMSARPIADIGAGAALLGARSDPADVLSGALQTLNPINWIKGAIGAGRLITHPIEIPQAATDAMNGVLEHPGAAAGGAFASYALPGLTRGAIRTAQAIPAGRLANAAGGAAMGAIKSTPVIGPAVKGAIRGAQEAWEASAPAVAESAPVRATVPEAHPAMSPAVKPKLSAPELMERMRAEYGSDKAGRMIYGKSLKPLERKEAVKRLAPGESQLPNQAKRAIAQQYGQFQEYLASAPNQRARDYILSLMKGGE